MTAAMKNYVITIGRQFGSGGRVIGRLIADKLGIAFYDKELMLHAAAQAGLNPEFFEHSDERVPRFINGAIPFNLGMNVMTWYSGTSSISDDCLYRAQSDFIHSVAAQAPCVIVGRSADYVLRDMPGVISVFIHAPIEVCAQRILSRSDSTDLAKARRLAERTNKLRANYYNFYTDKVWGDAASYDLCVDSSKMPVDAVADMIIAYVRARLACPQ